MSGYNQQNLTTTTVVDLSVVASQRLQAISYWAGIRTPSPGCGLQITVTMDDPLGFTSVSTSTLVDGSAPGSCQGIFSGRYSGGVYLFTLEYLGAPGMEFDFDMVQLDVL